MTRSKALLQLILALVLAVAAGLMVFNWMAGQKRTAPAPIAQAETAPVVVATRDLPRGLTLTQDMLRVVELPANATPARAFTDPAQVEGRVLIAAVGEGETLTPVRLTGLENTVGGVSAMIAPGYRAMAVKGNKVMGLSGFIRPGDRVDVIVTLMTEDEDAVAMTKTVLGNVRVLATGEEFEPSADGEPSSVDTYTLEVTPEQSEILALATNQGTLNFALRSVSDDTPVLTQGADVTATLAALRPTPALAPKQHRATARKPVQVEVIT
ncbi:MAG: Flp pilus assembly protein CpaB, partial [Proteobacteria bacterium]|nr:Flp pilus assembly protein CpaB [Pseudomonadota bacterium]